MNKRWTRAVRRPSTKPSVYRRLLAVMAWVTAVFVPVVVAVVLLHAPLLLAVGVLGALIAVPAGWAAVCTRAHRWATGSAAFAGLVVTALVTGLQTWHAAVLVAVFTVASLFTARLSLVRGPYSWMGVSGRAVAPARHGVLVANRRSGGGKVSRFGLLEAAQRQGVRTILIEPGDDVRALAEQAVAEGADVLGVAGGDGTQALVAEVAHRFDVGFVCVPAGTRNHFALDLGLSRRDVAAALGAFGGAVERAVDLAWVGDRAFVNNASLGVYAEIVQEESYRDAKVATATAKLAELLGPSGPVPDLRYADAAGDPRTSADVLMVSNNAYTLLPGSGLGTRPHLDSGLLGVVAVRARGLAVSQWSTAELRVDSAAPLPVGVDGEALWMTPPLRFRIVAGALRVRLPRSAAAASHITIRRPGFVRTAVTLARMATGRRVRPAGRAD